MLQKTPEPDGGGGSNEEFDEEVLQIVDRIKIAVGWDNSPQAMTALVVSLARITVDQLRGGSSAEELDEQAAAVDYVTDLVAGGIVDIWDREVEEEAKFDDSILAMAGTRVSHSEYGEGTVLRRYPADDDATRFVHWDDPNRASGYVLVSELTKLALDE